jgi:hypothetical protein
MKQQHEIAESTKVGVVLTLLLSLALNAASLAQSTASASSQTPFGGTAPASPPRGNQAAGTATHITPEQAKQLFALVDQLIKFSSDETGLPIKGEVKRKLISRPAFENYLKEKFDEDEEAKRMERSEIVLKKFGFLDRDFNLKPLLLSLLKEQIAAFYDPKTKTVNLLDWVSVDEQRSILVHELTHALQDQHVDLEKWSDATPHDVSTDAKEDTDHLQRDELDTAREAVTEGQANAVMMDNILKPMGHSLIKDPDVVDVIKRDMANAGDSPVLARAPLLLSEALMFPYREGLSFEQEVWMDKGQAAAFTGALDRPPTSSWEIMNPREYEQKHIPLVPLLPDIHPLVEKLYRPYDIGQVGEFDVHILAEIFGGENASRDLTPAWDGGIYWAGQLRSATAAEQSTTKSIAIFYLSNWKSAASAQSFATLYTNELGRKYSGLRPDNEAKKTAPSGDGEDERVYSTDEGPVVITTRGSMVFVTESFPLPLARNLTSLILDAQGSGETRIAASQQLFHAPSMRSVPEPGGPGRELSADMVHFLGHCGIMRVAVDAELHAAR